MLSVMRAALDVFTNEPDIHPELRDDYRVVRCPRNKITVETTSTELMPQILSPHCAAAPGGDFAQQMNAEVVQNIVTYLMTGKPQSAVNADAVHQLKTGSN